MERILSKRPRTQTVDCKGSSNLIRARYNLVTKEMQVDFMGGSTYAYDGVLPAVWTGFKTADSKGKYLAVEIKPNYPARRIET